MVANLTLGGRKLRDEIMRRVVAEPSEFFVVVPSSLPGGLFNKMMDAMEGMVPGGEEARADAAQRLHMELAWIRGMGAEAAGEVGDPEPDKAVEEAVAAHPVDEVILSTLPAGASAWLAKDLPSRLERSLDVPITTVVAEDDPSPLS